MIPPEIGYQSRKKCLWLQIHIANCEYTDPERSVVPEYSMFISSQSVVLWHPDRALVQPGVVQCFVHCESLRHVFLQEESDEVLSVLTDVVERGVIEVPVALGNVVKSLFVVVAHERRQTSQAEQTQN